MLLYACPRGIEIVERSKLPRRSAPFPGVAPPLGPTLHASIGVSHFDSAREGPSECHERSLRSHRGHQHPVGLAPDWRHAATPTFLGTTLNDQLPRATD